MESYTHTTPSSISFSEVVTRTAQPSWRLCANTAAEMTTGVEEEGTEALVVAAGVGDGVEAEGVAAVAVD